MEYERHSTEYDWRSRSGLPCGTRALVVTTASVAVARSATGGAGSTRAMSGKGISVWKGVPASGQQHVQRALGRRLLADLDPTQTVRQIAVVPRRAERLAASQTQRQVGKLA